VVWPASQTILPPLVMTAGEKARSFWVALPSRYCTEDEDAGCCGAETTLPPVRSPSPAPTIPTSPSAKRLNVGSPFLWNRLLRQLIRAMIAPGLSRLHSDKTFRSVVRNAEEFLCWPLLLKRATFHVWGLFIPYDTGLQLSRFICRRARAPCMPASRIG